MLPKKKLTPTLCQRTECLYHRTTPNDPNRFLCTHAHKPNYADSNSCPLFKLDWQKKLKQTREQV